MSFPFPVLPTLKINDFEFYDEVVGEGNFAHVRRARQRISGVDFAVKQICRSQVIRLKKELDVVMEKHALMRYDEKIQVIGLCTLDSIIPT
jgi:hypothetical protein